MWAPGAHSQVGDPVPYRTVCWLLDARTRQCAMVISSVGHHMKHEYTSSGFLVLRKDGCSAVTWATAGTRRNYE